MTAYLRFIPGLELRWSPLRRNFHVIDGSTRGRNWFSNFSHHLEMRRQGILEIPARLFLSVSGRCQPGTSGENVE
jgi:hypothetical protein